MHDAHGSWLYRVAYKPTYGVLGWVGLPCLGKPTWLLGKPTGGYVGVLWLWLALGCIGKPTYGVRLVGLGCIGIGVHWRARVHGGLGHGGLGWQAHACPAR
jgi:hypothetical protein